MSLLAQVDCSMMAFPSRVVGGVVVVDAVGIVRGCLPLRFFVCVVFAAEPMRRGRWSTLQRQSFAAEDKASPADNSPTECQS